MESWLLPLSILFVIINSLSVLFAFRMKPSGYWRQLDAQGTSNGHFQFMCTLGGLYLLLVLTVAGHERALAIPAILIIADTLSLLMLFRSLKTEGAVARYYRTGIGLYLSVWLHLLYFAAAVVLLWT